MPRFLLKYCDKQKLKNKICIGVIHHIYLHSSHFFSSESHSCYTAVNYSHSAFSLPFFFHSHTSCLELPKRWSEILLNWTEGNTLCYHKYNKSFPTSIKSNQHGSCYILYHASLKNILKVRKSVKSCHLISTTVCS